MSQPNPLNYLGIAVLGAALLWAVRLIYANRASGSPDTLKIILLLAGWISLLLGTLGVVLAFSAPLLLLPIVGVIIAIAAYLKYMSAERRALLWALAVAAEKGIPLEQAARAFADERSVQIGSRVRHLANLLESGVPLPAALALSRNALPSDALLAARIGAATGQMGAALRMSMAYGDHFDRTMRAIMAGYFYIVGLLLIGSGILTFVMLKIVPVYAKMFEEFELELPRITQFIIAASELVVQNWFFFHPSLTLILLIAVSYYFRWSRYELPLFNRLWRRCDGALVMRALSLAVRQQRELGPTIRMLAEQYPSVSVGRRLERAAEKIDGGVHWCDALRSVGLLTWTDVGLLRSAERLGNLAWALEEMSDSALRRLALRLRIALSIGFPLIILAVGFVVLVIVTGLFLPLISMIQGLS
jgi:type II secretory pathway component PulF